jgi:2'-5' RNA ligase
VARLFVAVVPPPEVVDRLRSLDRPEGTGVRWVPEHQWHVTLRFLADVDQDEAIVALAQVDQKPAFVELGPAIGRLGERVIGVPAGGLDALASVVTLATDGLGAPASPVPFRGHLTLGRTRDGDVDVRQVGSPFAARFVAHRLVLLESNQDADGHHHVVAAEWPLRSEGDPA